MAENWSSTGEPSVLFLNDGHGKFRRLSWTDGTFRDESGAPLAEVPWELSFTVAIRDINQDGNPDIYVCNDFQDPGTVVAGDGHGGFRAVARRALRSTPHFSMTADFADIDNDGADDLFVTDMISRSHGLRMRQVKPDIPPIAHTRERCGTGRRSGATFLFLNRGDGTYGDIANYSGVASSDWSWSTAFLDVDLDGSRTSWSARGTIMTRRTRTPWGVRNKLSQADKNDVRIVPLKEDAAQQPRQPQHQQQWHRLHDGKSDDESHVPCRPGHQRRKVGGGIRRGAGLGKAGWQQRAELKERDDDEQQYAREERGLPLRSNLKHSHGDEPGSFVVGRRWYHGTIRNRLRSPRAWHASIFTVPHNRVAGNG